jgi:hydrogenase nickel incorporation protein HypA/HybF
MGGMLNGVVELFAGCGSASHDLPRCGDRTLQLKEGRVHELSIAQSLLEIIVDESKRHGLERINKVILQIGEFAAVVPESLKFCFELVSRDTVASGARIEIESVGITARCEKCDFSFDVQDQVFLCPRCGEPALDLLSGRELTVMSIEGETGEE